MEKEHISQHLTISEILPHCDNWIKRGSSTLSFRITQVLTGHECFGKYPHRIGAEEHPTFHECGASIDSVQHLIEDYPQFEEQRPSNAIGLDISPTALVGALLNSD